MHVIMIGKDLPSIYPMNWDLNLHNQASDIATQGYLCMGVFHLSNPPCMLCICLVTEMKLNETYFRKEVNQG